MNKLIANDVLPITQTNHGGSDMNNRRKHLERWLLLACIFILPLTGGCDTGGKVSVNLHGVNYTDKGFRYIVTDPSNPANSGGGELVGAYSAGGIMCCYMLPKRWKPGIQVHLKTKHRSEPTEGNPYGEPFEEQITVEVPRYATGKPGDLWVIRHADGSMGVISSDYQPDHEKWPGDPKGWPEPSLEFQRKLWDQQIEHAEGAVQNSHSLIADLKASPEQAARDAWELDLKYQKDKTVGFSGPDDPNYRLSLEKRRQASLSNSEARLKELREGRP